jgi:transcriptional regulator with XRE-family HTH domain
VAGERKRKTRLRQIREALGLSQDGAAGTAALSVRTYQRLETGGLASPPLRHLVNCALAFGVDLEEVCEPEWLEWTPPHPSRPKPQPLTSRQRAAIEEWRRTRHP